MFKQHNIGRLAVLCCLLLVPLFTLVESAPQLPQAQPGLSAKRQESNWMDTIANLDHATGTGNIRSGLASLYAMHLFQDMCDKDENGIIKNRVERITSKVAGVIFGVYGAYRLRNGQLMRYHVK
ncbi:hypothetical protein E3Q06_04179 [Wallemia mellicola]|nr:hypothetical protein E3Q21_04191 [Wallemia mellicola]TIB83392.1 hypothetical protein E3Q20_04162 [Wallemia mellicola]TIC37697.1 hypothetical protein E3Q07_04201 [Wallemia mellicola]TIC44710.1 hypothetical protein E3Q06_04179 [Wallemia mellicola]